MATKETAEMVLEGCKVDLSPLLEHMEDRHNWHSYDPDSDTVVMYLGPSPIPSFALPFEPAGLYVLVDIERLTVSGVQLEGCHRLHKQRQAFLKQHGEHQRRQPRHTAQGIYGEIGARAFQMALSYCGA